ncbi:MAG TPA: hypothetical protein VI410_06105 [Anaerolineales bacterium]|nr:hypothetical protein [Anaerolineales bacterium]
MQGSRELWPAGLAVALITGLYAGATSLAGVPAASGFLGHSLGVLGFLLMLATETLYSLRKRAIRRPWGRMRDWLRFHIFTGIVGPYLVLLHSAWEFRGLAGVVTLLTVIVVLSGFTGRYIYTAVPRTADGIVLEAEAIQAEIAGLNAELEAADLAETDRRQLAQRAAAERRRRRLERQITSLASARRMLSLWHTVHIPLGMALFVAAIVHAAGALYYATLLR